MRASTYSDVELLCIGAGTFYLFVLFLAAFHWMTVP